MLQNTSHWWKVNASNNPKETKHKFNPWKWRIKNLLGTRQMQSRLMFSSLCWHDHWHHVLSTVSFYLENEGGKKHWLDKQPNHPNFIVGSKNSGNICWEKLLLVLPESISSSTWYLWWEVPFEGGKLLISAYPRIVIDKKVPLISEKFWYRHPKCRIHAMCCNSENQ